MKLVAFSSVINHLEHYNVSEHLIGCTLPTCTLYSRLLPNTECDSYMYMYMYL